MIKIALFGCNGKMGQVISNLLANDEDAKISFGFDINTEKKNSYPVYDDINKIKEDADVVIDFSHPALLPSILEYCKAKKKGAVIATTGLSEEQIAEIEELSKEVPVFRSANMSLGIAALIKAAKSVLQFFPDADIEIVEAHHNKKVDAPSGTALLIGNELKEVRPDSQLVCGRSGYGKREKNDIGISAIRMGAVVGEHTVYICTEAQTITLTHTAHNRRMLAEGTIMAAEFLYGKPVGKYNMNDLTKE